MDPKWYPLMMAREAMRGLMEFPVQAWIAVCSAMAWALHSRRHAPSAIYLALCIVPDGREDILIAAPDGLKGISESLGAMFPATKL